MTYAEWRALWDSLDEPQRDSVRHKAKWEHMALWAVCDEWPGIWNDPARLAVLKDEDEDWRLLA